MSRIVLSTSAPISIHVPLARDDSSISFTAIEPCISIHVPLARDDLFAEKQENEMTEISIHVPLARDDGKQRDG